MPNFFTNTPDILTEYLQTGGRPAFKIRLALAATLSPSYGIYSGFELVENIPLRPDSEEYLNSETYEINVRNWDQSGQTSSRATSFGHSSLYSVRRNFVILARPFDKIKRSRNLGAHERVCSAKLQKSTLHARPKVFLNCRVEGS